MTISITRFISISNFVRLDEILGSLSFTSCRSNLQPTDSVQTIILWSFTANHFRVTLVGFTHFLCLNGKKDYNFCFDTGKCYWRPSDDGILFNGDNSSTWHQRYNW